MLTMSNTIRSLGSAASVYEAQGAAAAPGQPPVDLAAMDSATMSAEARLAGFPSGQYEEVYSGAEITRPSIFGSRATLERTDSGRAFVVQEGNWLGVNATL